MPPTIIAALKKAYPYIVAVLTSVSLLGPVWSPVQALVPPGVSREVQLVIGWAGAAVLWLSASPLTAWLAATAALKAKVARGIAGLSCLALLGLSGCLTPAQLVTIESDINAVLPLACDVVTEVDPSGGTIACAIIDALGNIISAVQTRPVSSPAAAAAFVAKHPALPATKLALHAAAVKATLTGTAGTSR